MKNDKQLIWEAYNDIPEQAPQRMLNEGLGDWWGRVNVWLVNKALPWLQRNKGKVAAAGGVAAAIAMYMGMDADTAQQAIGNADSEVQSQF